MNKKPCAPDHKAWNPNALSGETHRRQVGRRVPRRGACNPGLRASACCRLCSIFCAHTCIGCVCMSILMTFSSFSTALPSYPAMTHHSHQYLPVPAHTAHHSTITHHSSPSYPPRPSHHAHHATPLPTATILTLSYHSHHFHQDCCQSGYSPSPPLSTLTHRYPPSIPIIYSTFLPCPGLPPLMHNYPSPAMTPHSSLSTSTRHSSISCQYTSRSLPFHPLPSHHRPILALPPLRSSTIGIPVPSIPPLPSIPAATRYRPLPAIVASTTRAIIHPHPPLRTVPRLPAILPLLTIPAITQRFPPFPSLTPIPTPTI